MRHIFKLAFAAAFALSTQTQAACTVTAVHPGTDGLGLDWVKWQCADGTWYGAYATPTATPPAVTSKTIQNFVASVENGKALGWSVTGDQGPNFWGITSITVQ